ncbi:hypothetical protein JAAARDRAFT_190192 [Jaapia argillacea MUCL 33604]|uniref:Uncharacterized protein n=1 Tax=Jaapia argillacea MUCL 33604 TaxID=933084 RepID=A0A067Q2Z5_9AGAM|nr:hypothetical protein JAAARDRAFT_190192 [Jaapia argillacea MUCL 33604]
MLSGLTSLKLSINSGQEFGRPTLTTLLEILRSNPQLESLTLINCLPPTSSNSHPRHLTVLLAVLIFLHLEGEALCCSHLLSSLSLPTTTALKLSISDPTLSHFTSLFASAKNLGISVPILSLQISSSWSAITLRGYDCPFAPSHSMAGNIDAAEGVAALRLHPTPHIEIYLGLVEVPSESASTSTGSILTQGCWTMNLTCLEEIHAITMDGGSVGAMKEIWWRGLFEKLRGVRTLTVVGRACFEILAALRKRELRAKNELVTVGPAGPVAAMTGSSSSSSPAPDNRTGSSILLPNLITLSIQDANLEEFFYGDSSAPFIKVLVDTLTWREKCGRRVEMLVLGECQHIDRDVVDRIGENVGSIDWDGHCANGESDESDRGYGDEDFYEVY